MSDPKFKAKCAASVYCSMLKTGSWDIAVSVNCTAMTRSSRERVQVSNSFSGSIISITNISRKRSSVGHLRSKLNFRLLALEFQQVFLLAKISRKLFKSGFQWLDLHNLGAPRVIEGPESISAIKIAISTLKISFSTANHVAEIQLDLLWKVQMVESLSNSNRFLAE